MCAFSSEDDLDKVENSLCLLFIELGNAHITLLNLYPVFSQEIG